MSNDKKVEKKPSFKYSRYFFMFIIIVMVLAYLGLGEEFQPKSSTEWLAFFLLFFFLSLIVFSPIFIYESIKEKGVKFGILIIIVLVILIIFVFYLTDFMLSMIRR